MLNKERARIFMPFDAIAGFREGLENACKKCNTKKSISEEMEYELNEKIKELKKGDKIKITYYYNIDYSEIIGNVKKIDNIYKEIILENTKIKFEDILDVIKY
ncbi:MAG: YolD-like family protein [Firmicutes bacterium]|nr:YolD-like family protein [Bacillota bacterium]